MSLLDLRALLAGRRADRARLPLSWDDIREVVRCEHVAQMSRDLASLAAYMRWLQDNNLLVRENSTYQVFEPLDCACYPGCWGQHSNAWPALVFPSEQAAQEAYRRCHQGPRVGVGRPDPFPVGSYVLIRSTLRFCTPGLRSRLVSELGFVLGEAIHA